MREKSISRQPEVESLGNEHSVKFHIIHPTIVDLYVNALTLHILQEQLSKVGPDGLTNDVQMEIDKVSSEYVISIKEAEDLFGDPSNVQAQLNAFTSQRKGIA